MEMNMNLLRHCFYMLGNNQQERLDNCKRFDELEDAEKTIEMINLVVKCESERNRNYVAKIISKH